MNIGTFTLLACLITLYHQSSHARHFENPDVQSRILAILSMVHIYGVTSWLALVFPTWEHILGAVRDCYEAYVVYTFFAFLIAILADKQGFSEVIRKLKNRMDLINATNNNRRQKSTLRGGGRNNPDGVSGGGSDQDRLGNLRSNDLDDSGLNSSTTSLPGLETSSGLGSGGSGKHQHHKQIYPPLSLSFCISKVDTEFLASSVFWQCFSMTMQFVLLKPLLAIIPYCLTLLGVQYYNEPVLVNDMINFSNPRLYMSIVQNVSVATAFYGLLSFYHALEQELEDHDPWPKFLCVKGTLPVLGTGDSACSYDISEPHYLDI